MKGVGEKSLGEGRLTVVSEDYFSICSSFTCKAEQTLWLQKRFPNHKGTVSPGGPKVTRDLEARRLGPSQPFLPLTFPSKTCRRNVPKLLVCFALMWPECGHPGYSGTAGACGSDESWLSSFGNWEEFSPLPWLGVYLPWSIEQEPHVYKIPGPMTSSCQGRRRSRPIMSSRPCNFCRLFQHDVTGERLG